MSGRPSCQSRIRKASMRLAIYSSCSQPPLLQRGRPLVSQYRRRQGYAISIHGKMPPGLSVYRSPLDHGYRSDLGQVRFIL